MVPKHTLENQIDNELSSINFLAKRYLTRNIEKKFPDFTNKGNSYVYILIVDDPNHRLSNRFYIGKKDDKPENTVSYMSSSKHIKEYIAEGVQFRKVIVARDLTEHAARYLEGFLINQIMASKSDRKKYYNINNPWKDYWPT